MNFLRGGDEEGWNFDLSTSFVKELCSSEEIFGFATGARTNVNAIDFHLGDCK